MNTRLKQALVGAVAAGVIGALAGLYRTPSRPVAEAPAPVHQTSAQDDLFEKRTLEAMSFGAPPPASGPASR